MSGDANGLTGLPLKSCNTLELTANGTRHSKEFASFLKGLLWRNARLRLALLNAIITLTAISLNGSTKNI